MQATREKGYKLAVQLGQRLLQQTSTSSQCLPSSRGAIAVTLQQFSAAAGADDANVLIAQPRTEAGTAAAVRLRKSGRIPGILFSLPEEDTTLLSFDSKSIGNVVHRLGRTGWGVSVFDVQIQDPESGETTHTYRALGRQVHMTADTDAIENVTLMHCPPDRTVRVKVPLKVFGEEVCPGIKAGGRINWIQRTIACVANGDAIPTSFEIDISHLSMGEKVLYSELQVPEGVELVQKDLSEPVIKIRK